MLIFFARAYATTSFKDTAGYGWAIPYLAFCQEKGIMIGDGQGNAMPGRTITVNEAITMILRALGYVDNSAELVGRWPANYVTLGKALFLYDDLSDEVYMDRENAAVAIYNALLVQLVAVNSDGKTEKRWKEAPVNGINGIILTLANAGLNCKVYEKIVLTPSYFGNSMINITDKLGEYGTAFENKDDILVAFSTNYTGSTLLTGKIDKNDFKVGDKVYSFDSNISSNQSYINGFQLMNNGTMDKGIVTKPTTNTSIIANLTEFIDSNKLDGKIVTLSVKASGLTIKEVYAYVGWSTSRAKVATEADVKAITANHALLANEFVLDDDKAIDVKQFSLVGVNTLEDIKTDNVVYVYKDEKDRIRKVAVGQEVVEGTIEKANRDDATIGGKAYKYAAEYIKSNAYTEATAAQTVINSVGEPAVARLDAYGNAFEIDTTGGVGLFGVLVSEVDADTYAGIRVRMTNEDDATKTYSIVNWDKVKLYPATRGAMKVTDKNDIKSNTTLAALVTYAVTQAATDFSADLQSTTPVVQPLLVGYKLDKDGVMTTVELPFAASKGAIKSTSVLVDTNANGGSKSYTIDKDAKVFSFVTKSGIVEVSSLKDIDIQVTRLERDFQYVLNHAGDKVVAILIDSEAAGATKDEVYGVINKVEAITVNGSAETEIQGYVNGEKVTLQTSGDGSTVFEEYKKQNDHHGLVLWKFERNAEGKVKHAYPVHTLEAGAEGHITYGAAVLSVPTASIGTATAIATKGAVTNYDKPVEGRVLKLEIPGDGTVPITAETDAIVYKATRSSKTGTYLYEPSQLASITSERVVAAYDTRKPKDFFGIANVIIYTERTAAYGFTDTPVLTMDIDWTSTGAITTAGAVSGNAITLASMGAVTFSAITATWDNGHVEKLFEGPDTTGKIVGPLGNSVIKVEWLIKHDGGSTTPIDDGGATYTVKTNDRFVLNIIWKGERYPVGISDAIGN